MVLKNYLADFNETYTCYKGGYVEPIYQFWSDYEILYKCRKYKGEFSAHNVFMIK